MTLADAGKLYNDKFGPIPCFLVDGLDDDDLLEVLVTAINDDKPIEADGKNIY